MTYTQRWATPGPELVFWCKCSKVIGVDFTWNESSTYHSIKECFIILKNLVSKCVFLENLKRASSLRVVEEI